MDFRKQLKRHPAHRPALRGMRRMRPRRDFLDGVAPLTAEEEKAFAVLQADMTMRRLLRRMRAD
ncbi:hypothetical protein GN316_08605 [Xylophilus sp. Kf1]|nr:hypothetical protein [Xylophilus sp. Kf1]